MFLLLRFILIQSSIMERRLERSSRNGLVQGKHLTLDWIGDDHRGAGTVVRETDKLCSHSCQLRQVAVGKGGGGGVKF